MRAQAGFIYAWGLAMTLAFAAPDASAVDYPARPIKLVVPYAAGGPTDVLGRVVADYLGQTLINTPRVFQTNFITQNIPGGTGALTLSNIAGGQDTIGLNSGAVGFKYNLFDQLLFTGDILFRMDNRGLRQDVTPLIALSYAFGR